MYEFRINIHFPCSSYSVFTNSWQNSLAAKCSSVFLYQLPVTHSPVKLAGKNQQYKSIISETLAFGPETKTSNLNLNRAPWYCLILDCGWTIWMKYLYTYYYCFISTQIIVTVTYLCVQGKAVKNVLTVVQMTDYYFKLPHGDFILSLLTWKARSVVFPGEFPSYSCRTKPRPPLGPQCSERITSIHTHTETQRQAEV